jgi:hypothetical protein
MPRLPNRAQSATVVRPKQAGCGDDGRKGIPMSNQREQKPVMPCTLPAGDLQRAAVTTPVCPQKHMEVRGQRLGVKLPHHHRDLTSMVSGMVRQMLREVYQCDFELNPMQSRAVTMRLCAGLAGTESALLFGSSTAGWTRNSKGSVLVGIDDHPRL